MGGSFADQLSGGWRLGAVIIVSVVLAVALVAVVHILLRSHRQAEQAWEAERRELLNRIQRPEAIPATSPEHYELPEPEEDFSALVGTIAEPEEVETG